MVRLDTHIDVVGGFPYSNMTNTNNSSIKNHTYRLINVLHGDNVDFFFNLCLLGLKFGMVRLDKHIDAVRGFPESNMSNTKIRASKNMPID